MTEKIRAEDEIREALHRMCQTVWGNRSARPFWHIPVRDDDVDVILYDAFDELRRYRAIFGPLPEGGVTRV